MKKTLTILAIASALTLSACGAPQPPGPAAHYTGTATITDSYVKSRKSGCKVVVKLPDGQADTLSVGRKTKCTGWDKGKSISISDGRLVR